MEKQNNYCIVTGFVSSGKTVSAKFISEKYKAKFLDYEELANKIKEEVSTEEDPVDEMTF